MSSYGVFAEFYDALTRNVRYDRRAKALHDLIRKHMPESPDCILLDLACGTGSFSEAFARLGWDVIGVDTSEEMLGEALDKKYDSGLPVQYLRQDMRELDMFGSIDATVCLLDSLNHLSAEDDVRRTFERVNLFSNAGAMFLFDVNTAYKHRKILGDNCFVYEVNDPEHAVCIWQNNLDDTAPGFPVTVALDFFTEVRDEKYRRTTEEFTERIWPPELVESILRKTGFTLLEVLDGDTFQAPVPETQRLLYVSRASGGQKI